MANDLRHFYLACLDTDFTLKQRGSRAKLRPELAEESVCHFWYGYDPGDLKHARALFARSKHRTGNL
jgi:hypothetical protein